ncbi:hypothetical protein K2173_006188 [Erythroxylum novogranatense]|uniref:Uncharacterized protein n=1 Tax=Erythroxylum novogranatense TaxID=1862640 RepID=A0AAV8TEB8_9ROSI|nr:hypothetical protein K2173_006188 [Erythroxylum novogranatense]
MASTVSTPVFGAFSQTKVRNAHPPSSKAQASKPAMAPLATRRHLLFCLTAAPMFFAGTALAEDIPLFGLRKKLRKVEEEAEKLVKEGFETAEKGLETAEIGIEKVGRGIEAAEEGIEAAEEKIEETVSFGGLAQAGAVAGAEVVGVVVATSIVNGILGPEA